MLIDASGNRIAKEKINELALQLKDDVFAAFEAQSARMKRADQMKAEVECTKIEKRVPFKGASTVHLPLTMEILHTAHVLTRRVIFGTTPIVVAVPPMKMKKEAATLLSKELSEFLHLAMMRGGALHAIEAASWSAAIGGTGIVRVSWNSPTKPQASRAQAMRRPFIGAVLEHVPRRDFFMFPAHSKTVDEAKGVGHQFWLRLSEIKARARQGEYDPDAVENIVGEDVQPDLFGTSTTLNSGMRVAPQDLQDNQERYVRLTEIVIRWRPTASEPMADWLVTFCPETQTILRLIPYPYEHGRRCYVPIYWLRDPDNFDGISLAWVLRGLNEEMDAQHRQYIDANTININQSWGISPHLYAHLKGKKMGPGQTLPLDMPGAAQRLFETVPIPNLESSKMLREEAERVVGISPTLMGVPLPGRRTATEVSEFVESGSAKIDDIVRTIHGSEGPYGADGIREIADQMRHLYHQYYDEWIEDTSAPIWTQSREVLLAPVTIVGGAQSVMMLPESKRQMLLMMWQLFNQDPFLISNPLLRLRLARRLAETSDVGTDWLPSEEEVKAGMQAAQVPAGPVNGMVGAVEPEPGVVMEAAQPENVEAGANGILSALLGREQ